MKTSEIKVSIAFIAYKHAKYLKQCLDSLVCQKCDFKYEIIIADDCSNDGSAEILLDYQKRYPDLIVPVIHEKNLGVTNNARSLEKYIHGKYVAGGECDDFWMDELRLQKQADFLDSHPECSAVGSNFVNVDSNGNNPYVSMLKWEVAKFYSLKDYLKHGMFIHGNTLMYRSEILASGNDKRRKELFDAAPTMTDIIYRVMMYDKGFIYIMPDVMHAHRMGDADKTSFFSSQKTKAIELSYLYCKIVDALNTYYSGKYDLSPLKANRTALVLMGKILGNYYVDKKEFDLYMRTLPLKLRISSYIKCFLKILRGLSHRFGRKLNMYYKLSEYNDK